MKYMIASTKKYSSLLFKKKTNFTTVDFPRLSPSDPEYGNLKEVLEKGGWHDFLTEKHTNLGPILYFWIKNRPAISLGHPKYWTTLTHLNSRPDHLRGYLIPLVGEKTINLINGKERDDRHKTYLNQIFSKESIVSTHSKGLEGHLKDALEDWTKYAVSGERFPLEEKMGVVLVSNIVDIMYGKKDLSYKELLNTSNSIQYALEHLEKRSFGKQYSVEDDKKIFDTCASLRNSVYGWIKEWETRGDTGNVCFLDSLKVESDQKIKFDNSVTFLIAGIGSTKFLFAMTIYHLASHPEKQKKLQKELDTYIKGKDITVDSLRNLKYLRACINETLRLTPSATTSARIDNENDHTLDDGVVIPKGTAIINPIGYIFQSEEFWKNSQEFYPERFREHGLVHPFQFNPFGFAGGRVCIGKNLSETETQLVVASFFKNFNVTLSKGQGKPKLQYLSGTIIDEEIYLDIKLRENI